MMAQPSDAPRAVLAVVETEAALLGAIMIDNRVFDRVADRLTADDFHEPVHQRLYALIEREIANGRLVTPVTLRPHLESDPGLANLGGPQYLAQLTGSGAGLIGAVDFAKQIADIAKRRRLYAAMDRMLESARDDLEHPIEALVDGFDAAMTSALQRTQTAKSVSFAHAVDMTLDEIEAEARGEGPTSLKIDGLDDWNKLTGGMRRGEVIILAGRPSMGKTAVGLSVALGSARAGHGTLFVSLEMKVPDLTKRAISDLIFEYGQSASANAVQRGAFTAFDRERLATAREQIKSWPLVLHQDAGLKIGRLAMLIRRYRRQMAAQGRSLDVVVVDYLGLVRSDATRQKRYEEVGEISRTLKEIAGELDVALVVLAQLNREVERRDDKRPQLSDLRDSGEIEQDADTVIFVYRDEYYLSRAEPPEGDKKRPEWEVSMAAARDRVELISAKVRKGAIGRRNCHFFASHQAVRGSDFFSSRGA